MQLAYSFIKYSSSTKDVKKNQGASRLTAETVQMLWEGAPETIEEKLY